MYTNTSVPIHVQSRQHVLEGFMELLCLARRRSKCLLEGNFSWEKKLGKSRAPIRLQVLGSRGSVDNVIVVVATRRLSQQCHLFCGMRLNR